MNKTQYLWLLTLIPILLGILYFSGINSQDQISLINKSSESIDLVRVEVNDYIFEWEKVQPSLKYSRRFSPTGDGSFKVTVIQNSTDILSQADSLGYVTKGAAQNHTLTIQPDYLILYDLE
ncbi:MAG: hypothetical protein SWJ54_00645 [Cyanobacteriota bacterium]|nr:hypothetical protein [Cyanobacteriota bacterium]